MPVSIEKAATENHRSATALYIFKQDCILLILKEICGEVAIAPIRKKDDDILASEVRTACKFHRCCKGSARRDPDQCALAACELWDAFGYLAECP